jgi:predicted aminopeptidase
MRTLIRAMALLGPLVVGQACSPIYLIRAGAAEAKILRARRPIPEVILDSGTDARTRGTLTFVREARQFAIDSLGLSAGDAYTSYSQLESDTLLMVLSASYPDRLQAKTWWFPIVGHVPYRGYFNFDNGARDEAKLVQEGFDTYLRPSGAFSTLGWLPDPLLSTTLRQDDVGVVETVIHELAHNRLFVGGQVRFNESYANFVGAVGAAQFFCTRPGGGLDTVKCLRAQARWRDMVRFSEFLDPVIQELQKLYLLRGELESADLLTQREVVFERAKRTFREEVQPSFEASSYSSFLAEPLNNATLLGRMRYYHRLRDFEGFLERHSGRLKRAIDELAARAGGVDDPFTLLVSRGLPD